MKSYHIYAVFVDDGNRVWSKDYRAESYAEALKMAEAEVIQEFGPATYVFA